MPAGGATGQVLAKKSAADNDTEWQTVAGATSGPAFRARTTANTTVPGTGVETQIAVPSVVANVGGCYNGTTSRFTPNVPGYYLIGYFLSDSNNTAGSFACISKNGSESAGYSASYNTNAAINAVKNGTALFYLNGTTDFVQLMAYQGTGSSRTMGHLGEFFGCFIRPA